MPFGVPRIPKGSDPTFRRHEEEFYDVLYNHRVLFLFHDINIENANNLITLLLHLNAEDLVYYDYFTLTINSAGGSLAGGLGLYNAMQYVYPGVQTLCAGMAASMASLILAGGTSSKRFAFPHARVMMHQPHAKFLENSPGRIADDVQELGKLWYEVVKLYVQKTGQPFHIILENVQRDFFLSATEAKTHGIIDGIL
uniref:ATP-dependent Clp protease proteolytic subunit n=1 Tax=Passiflora arbelaezii TaxID=298518 RepID=A0A4Y5QF38_9ROSI|nr:ATP-dependent Clp protease proteolytic subunit [Passiflora arbelaezii]QCX30247.1 ATP-dependent Clp protease proteolytic subunit [Passiflora arbelaezii]